MFLKCQVYKPSNLSYILEISITNSEEMNDTIVMIISQSFPNLEVLNLSNCQYLTELSIHSISTSVFQESLTSLNLSHNQADKSSLESLNLLTHLKYLNLSFLRNLMDSFTLNLSNFQQLQSLNLSSLHELNDKGLEVMLYHSGILYHSLKSLYITENYMSNETFLKIFTNSPFIDDNTSLSTLYSLISIKSFQLITLDLSWCDNITARSLSIGIKNCPLLQQLYLRSTSTDCETVMTIAQSCPNLVELNISRCNDINDICLKELSTLQHLNSLDISWASIQSHSTIEFLSESKSIEKLCLQGCKGLQSEMVDCLLNGAAINLKYLDLGWVNMFSSTMAEELSLKRKELIIVDYYMQVYLNGEVIAERM